MPYEVERQAFLITSNKRFYFSHSESLKVQLFIPVNTEMTHKIVARIHRGCALLSVSIFLNENGEKARSLTFSLL